MLQQLVQGIAGIPRGDDGLVHFLQVFRSEQMGQRVAVLHDISQIARHFAVFEQVPDFLRSLSMHRILDRYVDGSGYAARGARFRREGPMFLIFSVKSRTAWANLGPSAAEIHSRCSRPASKPVNFRRSWRNRHALDGHVIAPEVVAVADVAAADEHAVGPLLEGPEHVVGRDRPGAHDPDYPDVGRILQAATPARSAPA